ncbi:MAG: beta-lactamase family protein [Acholeplasmataceae bacterium]|nr:beta-lactamase family protein [Acholeplasmataceae bacterium]
MIEKLKKIDDELLSNSFSGLMLIAKNNQILISKAYGFADYEFDVVSTVDTKFRIASITKQLTAAVILQLVEKNKLSLKDTISKYFPDYPLGEKITIRHLLTHTCGIANFDLDSDFYDVYHAASFRDAMMELFKNEPLMFEPGSKFSYSIPAYLILGYIIEIVSGMSYEDYMEKFVFEPLKMRHTEFDHWRKIIKMRAKNYDFVDHKIVHSDFVDMRIAGAAGGLLSTAEDLFLWQQGLLNNQIISKESYDLMFSPQEPIFDYVSYGYGVFLAKGEIGGKMRRKDYHTGGGPGVRSIHIFYPDDQVNMILITNINDRDTFNQTSERIESIFFDE